MALETPTTPTAPPPGTRRSQMVIRFAGDSGDGMQLAGTRFTDVAAYFGNDLATFPSFPAEIRGASGNARWRFVLPGPHCRQRHFHAW